MERQQSFIRHERPAVVASVIWIGCCLFLCWMFGPALDISARMSLQELGDVATIASGIVAPVAVLWVVRSIHIQKVELASAVRAAQEQAKSIAEQARQARDQHEQNISPNVNLQEMSAGYGSSLNSETEDFHITCANVGRGVAVQVKLSVVTYRPDGTEIRRSDDLVIHRNLKPSDVFTHSYRTPLDGRERAHRALIILTAERSDRMQFERLWRYEMASAKLSEVQK